VGEFTRAVVELARTGVKLAEAWAKLARTWERRWSRKKMKLAVFKVEEGPDMWVPHVNGLRGGKRGTRVISRHHSCVARGHGLQYQKKGKCVDKISLQWQICNLNSKSGKQRFDLS
jgi:hypothetical protein